MTPHTIEYRWMEPYEATKLADIDRSEEIRIGYEYVDGELRQMEVNWDSPTWSPDGEQPYSVAAQIRFCQGHLNKGGCIYGALVEETLVGVGVIQHEIAPGMAQLAFLHVSNAYRRSGVGGRIVDALLAEARKGGAKNIYVSAVPSGSAVGFYLSRGFHPTDSPISELFALEPEDIHLIKRL